MNWSLLIIDATAGYRLMWRNKDTRWTVFLDKRVECRPDIICDDRNLPLRPHIADIIICDPPHMIRNDKSIELQRYEYSLRTREKGIWIQRLLELYDVFRSTTEWVNYAYYTNIEYARVIKHDGSMNLKLSHTPGRKHVEEHNAREHYNRFTTIYRQHYPSKSYQGNSETIWLTFKPNNLEETRK